MKAILLQTLILVGTVFGAQANAQELGFGCKFEHGIETAKSPGPIGTFCNIRTDKFGKTTHGTIVAQDPKVIEYKPLVIPRKVEVQEEAVR